MSSADFLWLDNESRDAIDYFWCSAGWLEEFPRSLERPLAFALPLALVKLPRLRLKDVEYWLRARGSRFSFSCQNRAMRGCLVASAGHGIVFVDGADGPAEQRVSVAHETAHFLVDYWWPRLRASKRFGSQILEAIDGRRPFTLNERLLALLNGTAPGVYTELMEREMPSDISTTWKIENRADRVAMALLAPPEDVLERADLPANEYPARLDKLAGLLQVFYGLPDYISRAYAAELLHASGKGPLWAESLRPIMR